MGCKSELYEASFKNKALKQKLETSKGEIKELREKLKGSYKN